MKSDTKNSGIDIAGTSNLDTQVDDLVQTMLTKHRYALDINPNMVQLVDKEKAAIYFASLQKEFEETKRVIQALSGSLLLRQLGVNQDVSASISSAKETLQEVSYRLKEMKIPIGLKVHFDHLMYSVQTVNRIFTKYSLENDIYFMEEEQLNEIFRHLNIANQNLKKSSTFSMGLGMISLETSCFCGLH
ncbi:hypothetical protein [Peribacillus frigoritolerans]|uniref:hypothetical protein n=1 Tax=Peribacillus frigoritolerans TaxID=450367 RepID=UPI00228183B8|nr:hypothetical protein [Peribacillus frigoritolerans]MCY9002475.1 hypothetical protein [Peribacillus frigoritolerans]